MESLSLSAVMSVNGDGRGHSISSRSTEAWRLDAGTLSPTGLLIQPARLPLVTSSGSVGLSCKGDGLVGESGRFSEELEGGTRVWLRCGAGAKPKPSPGSSPGEKTGSGSPCSSSLSALSALDESLALFSCFGDARTSRGDNMKGSGDLGVRGLGTYGALN